MSNFGSMAAKSMLEALTAKFEGNNAMFLTSSARFEVIAVCLKIKKLMNWNFDFHELQNILCKCHLPVDVLWSLHFSQLLSLEIYLMNVESNTVPSSKEISQSICAFCLADSKGDDRAMFAQTGVLIFLVQKTFDTSNENIKEICLNILDSVFEGIFSMEKQDITEERLKPFFDVWSCQTIEDSLLKAFSSYILLYFVKLPHATVLDAISTQQINKKDSSHIVLCKVISTLECDKMEELLFSLTSEDINWNNFLTLIDSFWKVQSQAITVISRLIDKLLKQAFQNQNSYSLQKAVLLGRHIALHSESSFPHAFKQWFRTRFAEPAQLKNPQIFSFFIQVLSSFIPYEKNVEMIKIALEPLFYVPRECQLEYADYIALLKTRVKDLEPRIYPEEILNKLLLAFQENEKIPPYILEASLMRKHYFLNEFLPILLAPRVLPQIADAREKFILELDRIGKIPGSMLQKYRIACLEEERKLLTGLNLNENLMEDL